MGVKFNFKKELSRKHLANPWADIPLYKRLVGSIKLKDNCEYIDHGNGYMSIVPIDKTKVWTEEEAKKHFG